MFLYNVFIMVSSTAKNKSSKVMLSGGKGNSVASGKNSFLVSGRILGRSYTESTCNSLTCS